MAAATEHNTSRASRGTTRPELVPPFLFVISAVAEFLSFLVMTLQRYANQGLRAAYFDFAKTANVLGILIELPFLLLFLLLAVLRRYHSMSLATTSATLACFGLVSLAVVASVSPEDRPIAGALYLAYKTLELAFFVVILRPGRTPLWRKCVSVVIFTIGLMTGAFLLVIASVLLSPIGSTMLDEPHAEYDAAVILGAAVWSGDRPSPVLRERINTGYDLLKNGTVQFLVLTGGNAPHELPEAEVARRELLKRGADPTRIVLETHTRSTVEQVLFIRNQLLKQGWSSFIIVSDQFHLKRALEICQFNDLDARGVSSESPLGPQNLAIYHLRESAALILYWTFGL
jgi:vancomycin permeability regulator SanA